METPLFEIKAVQTFHESRNPRTLTYQIPAVSANDALVKLGQTYNNADVYSISVLSIAKVQ